MDRKNSFRIASSLHQIGDAECRACRWAVTRVCQFPGEDGSPCGGLIHTEFSPDRESMFEEVCDRCRRSE